MKKWGSPFKPDIALTDRKKMLEQEMIGEAIIVFLLGFYMISTIVAYSICFPRESSLNLSMIAAVIKENPVFFLAVCCSKPQYLGSILGGGIFGALFIELFVVMDYYRRKAGLKNNIWTLKGSARFLTKKEVKQMVLHYAETE